MGVQLWGRHSLKGHLWQLPAASLEQMGMQCLHPRVRTGPPLSARVESGSSIRQLLLQIVDKGAIGLHEIVLDKLPIRHQRVCAIFAPRERWEQLHVQRRAAENMLPIILDLCI